MLVEIPLALECKVPICGVHDGNLMSRRRRRRQHDLHFEQLSTCLNAAVRLDGRMMQACPRGFGDACRSAPVSSPGPHCINFYQMREVWRPRTKMAVAPNARDRTHESEAFPIMAGPPITPDRRLIRGR